MNGEEPGETAPLGGQLLIYRDGARHLQVRLDGQTVWLTRLDHDVTDTEGSHEDSRVLK